MSNPTRQEIIDAHEALTTLYARAMGVAPSRALRERILAALPPKPRPTMAEVEWDDDLHYLAEAEHPIYGKVIMLFQSWNSGYIYFTYRSGSEQCHVYSMPADLTPTGRRYTLTEVQE
ncbi:hypothetical protein ACKFRM_06730 [Corynebacterium sp. YSMAA1_1_D6]|uniref:hypothetical protein n=1 Tax=Corynebacterium sp. YSMAA1_1_D6 TaxID=3383589 RepID=UPI0038D0BC91